MEEYDLSFSDRTDWPTDVNPITAVLEKFKKERVAYLDLTQSNPTTCGLRYNSQKILKPLSHLDNLTYAPEARGSLKAREAVSRYYKKRGRNVRSDQIVMTSSTSEGYSFIFKLLINDGEEILLPRPSYPLFDMLCRVNSVGVNHYALEYEADSWNISEKSLQNAISKQSKAIVFVNPNNPTGSYVNGQQIAWINTVCQKNHLAVISDEVFSDFLLDSNTPSYSFLDNDAVLTFVLGGVSKAVGLPQMKVSWIVVNGPKNVVDKALYRLELIADTYLSVSTPAQNALSDWLSLDDIQKQIQKRIRTNYEWLKSLKTEGKMELCQAQGGWYAVVKILVPCVEEELVLKFLEEDKVFVHPGYFFDFEEGNFLVLSLLTPPGDFKKGIEKVISRL